jgi:hypothetical protein
MTRETTPAQRLRAQRRRTNRVRNFPVNTCPASRHLHMIADALLSPKRTARMEDLWEPAHMAETMLSVLESLWKTRNELERLEKKAKAA